jgi:hypothetical protein
VVVGDDDIGGAGRELVVEVGEAAHGPVGGGRAARVPRLDQHGPEAQLGAPAQQDVGHRRGEDRYQEPVGAHAPRSGLSPYA